MTLVKAWSWSAWSLYNMCPAKYKYEKIDKLKQPQAPAMKRGNDMHVGIANYLKGTASVLPTEVLQHARVIQVIQEIQVFPDKVVEQQWGFTRQWEATAWFGDATWFRQVLDVGMLYEDLTAEAVDWKSGKRYGSNADQMELQALSVMCKYKPAKYVETRLVYLDSGEEEMAGYAATDRVTLQAKWEKKIAPMFNDVMFAPRPNDKCKWCHFSRSNAGPCKFG